MPPAVKVLKKAANLEELRDRQASLELVLQVYRDTQAAMSEEEKLLLHGKLQQIHTVRDLFLLVPLLELHKSLLLPSAAIERGGEGELAESSVPRFPGQV